MEDEKLQNIYDESYSIEFKNLYPNKDEFEKVRDQEYAIKVAFAAISFVHGLRTVTDLDRRVLENYDHYFKLGYSIPDAIRSIPKLIENYKIEKDLRARKSQKEVIIWKKYFGIPYNFRRMIVQTNHEKWGSYFEDLTSLDNMAEGLAKLRATEDIFLEFKDKYYASEKQVSSESINQLKDLLPVEFKTLADLRAAIETNNLVVFFNIFQSIFASIPYDIKVTEGYFHVIIHLLLSILNFNINSEVETNIGRIDAVIETEKYIHILELKLNDSHIAIEQILTKQYYQKYLNSSKKIILVGVAVDKKTRNIVDWKFQTYR